MVERSLLISLLFEVHNVGENAEPLPSVLAHVGVVQHSLPSFIHVEQILFNDLEGNTEVAHVTASPFEFLLLQIPQSVLREHVPSYIFKPGYMVFLAFHATSRASLKLKFRAFLNTYFMSVILQRMESS